MSVSLDFRWLTFVATAVMTVGLAASPAEPLEGRLLATQAHVERGEYAAAERILLELLKEMGQSRLEGLDRALVLNNLGSVYHQLGDYSKAESCLRQAVQIQADRIGAAHPRTLRSRVNLAILYLETQQPAKAERVGLRALLDQGPPVSVGATDWARILSTVGETEKLLGRYPQSVNCYREALTLWERLEPNGVRTAEALNNLGSALTASGRNGEALVCLHRGLSIADRESGREHPVLVHLLANIATAHLYENRFSQAAPFYERALDVAERILGREHMLVGQILRHYAVALERTNQKALAKQCRRRANAIMDGAAIANSTSRTVEFADLQRQASRAR